MAANEVPWYLTADGVRTAAVSEALDMVDNGWAGDGDARVLAAEVRRLQAETDGDRIEAIAGEALPFLVRIAARQAVRDVVKRWHDGGAPQDAEQARKVPKGDPS